MTQSKKRYLLEIYDFIVLQRKAFTQKYTTRTEQVILLCTVVSVSLCAFRFFYEGSVFKTSICLLFILLLFFISRMYLYYKLSFDDGFSLNVFLRPWYRSSHRVQEERKIFREYINTHDLHELKDLDKIDKEILDEISIFNTSMARNILIIIITLSAGIIIKYFSNLNNSDLYFSFATASILFYFAVTYYFSKRVVLDKLIILRKLL